MNTTDNKCAIDGCTNVLGSTGKRGRPSKKCPEHKDTCVVPGCTREANGTQCQYHRVDAYSKRKSDMYNAAKWITWFEERGYTVIPPENTIKPF